MVLLVACDMRLLSVFLLGKRGFQIKPTHLGEEVEPTHLSKHERCVATGQERYQTATPRRRSWS